MDIKVEYRPAIWIVRFVWFFAGALTMDSIGFLLQNILQYEEMNTGGAILSLLAGILFTYLAVKWDNQLLEQLKEEK